MRTIGVLIMLSTLLCCCTTRHSKPYSASKTAKVLSKCFLADIEPVGEEKIIKQPPYAAAFSVLRKNTEGFTFTAVSRVGYVGGALIISNYITTNYTTALMLYYNAQARELAKRHDLLVVSPDSIDKAPVNKVYLCEPEQLQAVADLYFDLQKLYDFNVSTRDYLRVVDNNIFGPSYDLYYLPATEQNMKNAKLIWSYDYWYRTDRDETLRERHNDPDIFLQDLYDRWNNAKREGKVPVWTPDRDPDKARRRRAEKN